MSNLPREVGFGEALVRGFGLAWRAPGVVGLGLLAEVAAGLFGLGLQLVLAALALRALAPLLTLPPVFGAPLIAGTALERASLPALLGAGSAAGLVVLALRLLWASAGARLFSLRLTGEPARFGLGLAAERLARAAQVGLLFVPVWLGARLFGATAVGAGVLVWARTLQSGWAAAGAALLALGLVLALFVDKAVDLLLRLWLVRAVAAGEGALAAFGGAWTLLVRSAGTLVALWVAFGLLGLLAGATAGAGGLGLAVGGTAAAALAIGLRLAGILVGGALLALFSSAELGAIATLDAGARGALAPLAPAPAPLASEPILATEVVLSTEPR